MACLQEIHCLEKGMVAIQFLDVAMCGGTCCLELHEQKVQVAENATTILVLLHLMEGSTWEAVIEKMSMCGAKGQEVLPTFQAPK